MLEVVLAVVLFAAGLAATYVKTYDDKLPAWFTKDRLRHTLFALSGIVLAVPLVKACAHYMEPIPELLPAPPSTKPKEPEHVPVVSNNLDAGTDEVFSPQQLRNLAQKIDNIEKAVVSRDAGGDDFNYGATGLSFSIVFRPLPPAPGRENFIYEAMDTRYHTIVSLYFDAKGTLVFRVKDTKRSAQVETRAGFGADLVYGNLTYLVAAYGSTISGRTLLRLTSNGRSVQKLISGPAIRVLDSDDATQWIGSNMNGKDGANFDSLDTWMTSAVSNAKQTQDLYAYADKYAGGGTKYLAFFRGQGMTGHLPHGNMSQIVDGGGPTFHVLPETPP